MIILALLTVLNDAALCGCVMLYDRSNVMVSMKYVLHIEQP